MALRVTPRMSNFIIINLKFDSCIVYIHIICYHTFYSINELNIITFQLEGKLS